MNSQVLEPAATQDDRVSAADLTGLNMPMRRELTVSFDPAHLTIEPAEHRRSPLDLCAALETHVRRLYASRSELPYHGWEHVQDVRQSAAGLVARFLDAGIEVDAVALDHAILLHDLLYPVEATVFNFDSKEQLASHYAYNLLRLLGAPEAHARKVERIINATHYLAEPCAVEEIIIRAADLNGLASDYLTFRSQTESIHREQQIVRNEQIAFPEFVRRQMGFMPLYVWRMLHTTSDAFNDRGASIWHEKTLANLMQLFFEVSGGRNNARVVAQVPAASENLVIREHGLQRNEFFIGVNNDDAARERALKEGRQLLVRWDSGTPLFFVPGSTSALPIPESSCDELHLSDAGNFSPQELFRVIRRGGSLIVYITQTEEAATINPPEIVRRIEEGGFQFAGADTQCLRFIKPPAKPVRA